MGGCFRAARHRPSPLPTERRWIPIDIDMKELEAFVAVVDRGSFSRAAESLYLTQPTISAHVAALERKLSIKLLVRTTKEIYPSDAGNLLYDYAKEILRLQIGRAHV